MIQVSIEVGSGAACFRLAVRAESIGRAVSIVKTRYPGGNVRMVFPIEPAAFFVKDLLAAAGPVEIEMPESIAG